MATARELLLPNLSDEELDQLRAKWEQLDQRIADRKKRRALRRVNRGRGGQVAEMQARKR